MLHSIAFIWLTLICTGIYGQDISLVDFDPKAKAGIGETLIIPIKIRNSGDKASNIVIQEIAEDLGRTQKHYFCLGENCMDASIKEYHYRLEAGETLSNLALRVEAGLTEGVFNLHYRLFSRQKPTEFIEIDLEIKVEEKSGRAVALQNEKVTVNEIYPNPVKDAGFIDYRINQDGVSASIILHNVLGNIIAEYPLSYYENRLKIKTEDLSPGIYFLTLYVDNQNVLTRKLIVRK
ncbi:MAG TPA: T9SS type A sorting domain-containing protein [Cyclobacteriaceae bacterium]|nr:T9SS type A sorting domain-containing protein [Cyclobacteriaceae bacterium]